MTCRRGTSNGNDRGNSVTRQRRRAWLLETYAADRPLLRVTSTDGTVTVDVWAVSIERLLEYPSVAQVDVLPTARCYRCGALVHDGTLSVDRIRPGGPYSRDNIRPACDDCNSVTGGHLGASRRSVNKVAVRRNRPSEKVDDELPMAVAHG